MLEDTATDYVERRDGDLGTELSLPCAWARTATQSEQ